jgi:membrane associated rhomboid family serine protease
MFPIRDHNPSERTPVVTYALIAANVAIFLYGLMALQTDAAINRFYLDYAMIPARISSGEGYHTLVTSLFLHAGWAHIAGNMLFLWIFGDNLEDEMGHVQFLIFYLACGVVADLAQFAVEPGSVVPTVGASGAIAGVMGGYLLLFPKARVDIFVFLVIFIRIFPIPAWVMLGLWFALQLLHGLDSTGAGGGVAYWAHAGGFVIGFLFAIPVWRRLGARAFWRKTDGHPPHPEARYPLVQSDIPKVRRK